MAVLVRTQLCLVSCYLVYILKRAREYMPCIVTVSDSLEVLVSLEPYAFRRFCFFPQLACSGHTTGSLIIRAPEVNTHG